MIFDEARTHKQYPQSQNKRKRDIHKNIKIDDIFVLLRSKPSSSRWIWGSRTARQGSILRLQAISMLQAQLRKDPENYE